MKIFKFLSIAVSVKAVTTRSISRFMVLPSIHSNGCDSSYPFDLGNTVHVNKYSHLPLYGHPFNTNTSLLQTVCFVPGQKKSRTFWIICSKFNLLNTDIPLIWTLSMASSFCVLIGFECRLIFLAFNFSFLQLLVACQILILHSSLVALRW